MKIESVQNTNFKSRVKTAHILELTTLTMFEPDGFMGMTNTMKQIYNVPEATGNRGYRYYAKLAGNLIMSKYPQIKDATKVLKETIAKNPNITIQELRTKSNSLIARIGEFIDIEL